MNRILWVIQIVLAFLFLASAAGKLSMPEASLAALYLPPPTFMRGIAILEILGALGLVLPGLLRTQQRLIPLAAAGLTVIMAGAVVTTLLHGDGIIALIPLAVGLLAAFVTVKRWELLTAHGALSDARPAAGGGY